ncbi:MAG: FAD/NAD(P)-binding protein [Candidatus Margulisiibacteriota bacterium]|jgi:sulfite reductase subunit B
MKNKIIIKDSEYNIKPAKIIGIRDLTSTEKLFEIAYVDGESLNHDPGQFVEVSIFGAGEAPISIASSPTRRGSFELCIRSVGKVTAALHRMRIGEEIGIRGPFGKGFPIRALEGNDLIFVGGGIGIVPLRSLIQYVLDNRREFGKVTILLGCKTPDNILFEDEIAEWSNRLDISFSCTVDKADPEWKGHVGVITNLLPGINVFPQHTHAVIVGPPIMYKYVIAELLAKKIPEHHIIVSLERHMKCGLGKCGHCQINNIYCCQDGPVFTYDKIKNLEEALR